ncbi:AbiU2 domain-containing protein [Bradyrhizobium yuanmingense]|uniref:HEPN AbiU2-like domain-containing protein n=1 Tax=Bradyrhizobium yuanmingense TaxID=108015 RepID=A0ABV4GED3_9BRAD|nr:hypothetical protein [Bradyrhizobium yuanmingense]
MFETWDATKRIAEAKRLTERLVDHAHYLLDIRENNVIVVYSDQLAKQIPRSYAANAFNLFREAMHQIEIVRLSALWDQAQIDNETILTVIELVDNEEVIKTLAEAARAQYARVPEPMDPNEPAEEREFALKFLQEINAKRGEEHANNAVAGLRKAIADARAIKSSSQLKSIHHLRHKHVAHYLTQTKEERSGEIIAPMKVGDEKPVLEASLKIMELLYCWVNGVGISFEESQKIDKKCARELWSNCKFEIVDRSKPTASMLRNR